MAFCSLNLSFFFFSSVCLIKLQAVIFFFYVLKDELLQLLILHVFLILTLYCLFFSLTGLHQVWLNGPVRLLVCTLPFSMSSILFTLEFQSSEV